jgi:thioredoxin 1
MKKIKQLTIMLAILFPFREIFSQPEQEKYKVYEFAIEGMSCQGCANTATGELLKMKGVKRAEVNFATKKATVKVKPEVSEKEIKKTIAALNFEALFAGDSLVKPLSPEVKSKLDITDVSTGNRINFQQQTVQSKITVFDFYAQWCGPCRIYSPKLEHLVFRYPAVALRKVDIVNWTSEIGKQLTKEYKMPGLPFTLVFDTQGKLLAAVEGNHAEKVEEIIIKYLK